MAARHAGVVGSPIAHSLSPVLHEAAYQALGLRAWSYHRTEVGSGALADHLAGLPPEWVGLSVTMPGKEEALAVARQRTPQARLTGAANTLVRTAGGWAADNTDVDGVLAALRETGRPPRCRRALVVGSGATARSVLVAISALGVREVWLQVRDRPRPATLRLADQLGLGVHVLGPRPQDTWAETARGRVDVAVSTVPAGTDPGLPPGLDYRRCTGLDVVYDPWPTRWAAELLSRGGQVVGGSSMLLHQGARQVQLMTGQAAPLEAMRRALAQAIASRRTPGPGETPA